MDEADDPDLSSLALLDQISPNLRDLQEAEETGTSTSKTRTTNRKKKMANSSKKAIGATPRTTTSTVAAASQKISASENANKPKHEHPIDILLWPPLEHMPPDMVHAVRVNLADYIRDDPKSGANSDDWGFIFNERDYPGCERSTQEKLVSHIQESCAEQGFQMTVHTWANPEERGTLRIRLKCSHNRRSKCKFAFQLCYGMTEKFWYLRRGNGKHIHSGHILDQPKTATGSNATYIAKSEFEAREEARKRQLQSQAVAAQKRILLGTTAEKRPAGSLPDAYDKPRKLQKSGPASYDVDRRPSASDERRLHEPDRPRLPFGSLDEINLSRDSTLNLIASHSMEERAAADAMIAGAMSRTRSPMPPIPQPLTQQREISMEPSEDRRKRFLLTATTFSPNSSNSLDDPGHVSLRARQSEILNAPDQRVIPPATTIQESSRRNQFVRNEQNQLQDRKSLDLPPPSRPLEIPRGEARNQTSLPRGEGCGLGARGLPHGASRDSNIKKDEFSASARMLFESSASLNIAFSELPSLLASTDSLPSVQQVTTEAPVPQARANMDESGVSGTSGFSTAEHGNLADPVRDAESVVQSLFRTETLQNNGILQMEKRDNNVQDSWGRAREIYALEKQQYASLADRSTDRSQSNRILEMEKRDSNLQEGLDGEREVNTQDQQQHASLSDRCTNRSPTSGVLQMEKRDIDLQGASDCARKLYSREQQYGSLSDRSANHAQHNGTLQSEERENDLQGGSDHARELYSREQQEYASLSDRSTNQAGRLADNIQEDHRYSSVAPQARTDDHKATNGFLFTDHDRRQRYICMAEIRPESRTYESNIQSDHSRGIQYYNLESSRAGHLNEFGRSRDYSMETQYPAAPSVNDEGLLPDHTRQNQYQAGHVTTGHLEDRRGGFRSEGGGLLADHTGPRYLAAPQRPAFESRRDNGFRETGELVDHTARPPQARVLADHTEGSLPMLLKPKDKNVRGASFFSSIDTFQFSSAGSLSESEEDINKLEGFGGGTPATRNKDDESKGIDRY